MIKHQALNPMATAVALALVVNLLLFALLPSLRSAPPQHEDAIRTRAVSMVRLQEMEPVPPPPAQQQPQQQDAPPKPRLELPIDPVPAPTASAPVLKAGSALPELDTRAFEPAPMDLVFGESDLEKPVSPSHNPAPLYPFQAKRMGLEGSVEVQFLVETNGSVSDIKIVAATPANIFDKAVIDAVSRWIFKPGEITGEPVRVRVSKVLHFKLNR